MESKLAVKLDNVSKIIDKKQILSQVNLEVAEGKIVGLVGRNGSGKTMIFRMISGFVYPTEGRIFVFDKEVGKDGTFPQDVGVIIETPGFIPEYSGFKNLKMLASLRNKISDADIEQVMEQVGLDPRDKKAVRKYSLGMRQRLGIAQAIMEQPKLLLLDEPTNGLDTDGVEMLHQLLLNLRKDGVSILLASHYMEEIEKLCDEVYKVEKGTVTPISDFKS
ncbi:ABC transporter ATP-binding protein [Laceyella sacchari]|uniref:ATP-binding cassette domain-containing protein n=1 Tax=Laceyella sacchari TaxID=37482 RepID=A0ABY5U352_LACSH|nr:ATP-binding cassette domain-containing protein [Laceyella sacchari]UWE04066.1 ATP-binding cassette domain-containing protein [Laceyella sacchari]